MGIRDWFRRKPQPKPARRRGFEGAMYNRLVSDWVTSSTSMDAEIRKDLKKLRERARDLARNNDYAKNALRVITNNVVGQGITMQAAVKMRRGNKMDDVTNTAIEAAWDKWKRKSNCHTGGTLSFADIERQVMHAVAESGEVFVRKVNYAFGKSKVPLALEIIEADRLDEMMNEMARNGNEIRMGIERNTWGRPVAYHFKRDHPGDYPFGAGAVDNTTKRIPADEIIHLYKQDRPGQTRGVPWLASAIMRMHHLHGYTEAEVIAARAEACRMGFIQSPEDDAMQDGTDAGQAVTNFEPGKIERLQPGETYTESKPNRPGGQFEPFVRAMLRSMAAGIGVSYATLSRDYSDTNYSSSRLALLDDRDNWRVLQSWLIENFHKPIFEQWLDYADLSGELNLPNYNLNPDTYRAVRWIPRGWQWVDPVKEIAAYKEAVRCGFTTQADVIAAGGGDIEDVFQQRQRELELANQMDLVFDTDPSSVAGNGSAQADPAPAAEPAATDDTPARELQPQVINLNPAFEMKAAPPVELNVTLEQERTQVKRTVRLIRDENGAVTGAETTEE